MKKIFTLVFSLATVLLCVFSLSSCMEGTYTYELNGNGDAVITRFNKADGGAFYVVEDVTVPETIDGYKIVEIADGAFSDVDAISSVTVPEGVVKIGKEAFLSCDVLAEVNLPASLSEIGDSAFACCDELEYIHISPDNPTFTSRDSALYSKDQKTIVAYPGGHSRAVYTVNEEVTSIANGAFHGATNLREIAVKSKDVTVGEMAFAECDNLQMIEFLGNAAIGSRAFYLSGDYLDVRLGAVTEISADAFYKAYVVRFMIDEENPVFKLADGVVYDAEMKTLLFYPTSCDKSSFDIPGGVEKISDYAFASSLNLISLTLPEGLCYIGEHAFSFMMKLDALNIPASVEYIGGAAFYDCAAKVSIDENNAYYKIDSSLIMSKNGEVVIDYRENPGEESFVVPNGVKVIEKYAFYDCKLESISLPETLERIEEHAFELCDLRSLTVPTGVKYIGDFAFKSNDIETLFLGSGVEYIGEGAFLYGDYEQLVIPASIKYIGERAFGGAWYLEKITFENKEGWKILSVLDIPLSADALSDESAKDTLSKYDEYAWICE